ncbi:MAG: hypothetical protein KF766_14655 [Rhodocyclaceae bacterium]|nr:hypothetical protein [Rhodocyclaceae bacterium]MCB1891796.1 hypothetical protein [Rhodocyclaceae bacterium]
MAERKYFYPSLAAMLAMLAAAAIGYLWLPRADVSLPLVEGCRLDRQACASSLPGGGRVVVALEAADASPSPMRISVSVDGAQADHVEVGFQGVDMNMGLHVLQLAPAGEGRFAGETTLPVCVTGRMIWQATVLLQVGRKDISVPFRFESGHG